MKLSKKEKKWWLTSPAIITGLILFFPVGIYQTFKSDWSNRNKGIAIGLGLLFGLLVLGNEQESNLVAIESTSNVEKENVVSVKPVNNKQEDIKEPVQTVTNDTKFLEVYDWVDLKNILPPQREDVKEVNLFEDVDSNTYATLNTEDNTLTLQSTIWKGVRQGSRELSYYYNTYSDIVIDLDTMNASFTKGTSKSGRNYFTECGCKVKANTTEKPGFTIYSIYADDSTLLAYITVGEPRSHSRYPEQLMTVERVNIGGSQDSRSLFIREFEYLLFPNEVALNPKGYLYKMRRLQS